MKTGKILPVMLSGVLILTGCGENQVRETESSTGITAAETAGEDTMTAEGINTDGVDVSDMFTDSDMEIGYDTETSAVIELLGTEVSCSSDAVYVDGTSVTITDEGTYILTGSLDDGMIIVDADDADKVRIVLDQADIYCSDSAAVYIRSADKVFITTAGETENTLSNSGTYAELDENNIDAVIFSKDDLTLNGAGTLTVESPGGHGIVSKDDLVLTSGTYDITASNHGISGKDSVRISGGEYSIDAGKDGIHAENDEDASLGYAYISGGTFQIVSDGDGISAGYWLQTDGGEFAIETGGGYSSGEIHTDSRRPEASGTSPESGETQENTDSMKGIKATTSLILNGGTYEIDAADDALHSNGPLSVTGGTFEIASGDDAVHGDGDVSIQGGNINITASYEGIEGLTVEIAGGEIDLVSEDDGINAAGGTDSSGFGGRGGDRFASEEGVCITISGGKVYINASGDGIDSNGDFYVTGGETYVSGPSDSGNGAVDYNGESSISGGIFAASGSGGMESGIGSGSAQGVIMVSMDTQEAGTTAVLSDETGTELISWEPEKAYSFLIFSCPEIKDGSSYTVTAGSSETEIVMDGLVYGTGAGMNGMNGMNGERKGKGGMNGTGGTGGREGAPERPEQAESSS